MWIIVDECHNYIYDDMSVAVKKLKEWQRFKRWLQTFKHQKCRKEGTKILKNESTKILEDCQQLSSMFNASGMLRILDLVSLARLAGWWAVRYKLVGMKQPKT